MSATGNIIFLRDGLLGNQASFRLCFVTKKSFSGEKIESPEKVFDKKEKIQELLKIQTNVFLGKNNSVSLVKTFDFKTSFVLIQTGEENNYNLNVSVRYNNRKKFFSYQFCIDPKKGELMVLDSISTDYHNHPQDYRSTHVCNLLEYTQCPTGELAFIKFCKKWNMMESVKKHHLSSMVIPVLEVKNHKKYYIILCFSPYNPVMFMVLVPSIMFSWS